MFNIHLETKKKEENKYIKKIYIFFVWEIQENKNLV